MSRPGYRAMVAKPRPLRETVSIDYADVLEQAVENERWRIIREISQGLEKIETLEPYTTHTYRRDERTAKDFQKDALALVARLGKP